MGKNEHAQLNFQHRPIYKKILNDTDIFKKSQTLADVIPI